MPLRIPKPPEISHVRDYRHRPSQNCYRPDPPARWKRNLQDQRKGVSRTIFRAFRCRTRFFVRSKLRIPCTDLMWRPKTSGGGIAGQAGALRLAISRAHYAERRHPARLAARRRTSHARSPDEGAKEVGSAWSAQTVSVLKAIVARVLHGAAALTGFSVDFYRG